MLKVGSRVWYNDPVIGGIYYICKIQPSNPLDKTSELVYSIGDSPNSGYIRATMLAEILGKLASMTKEELDNLEPFAYPTFED